MGQIIIDDIPTDYKDLDENLFIIVIQEPIIENLLTMLIIR